MKKVLLDIRFANKMEGLVLTVIYKLPHEFHDYYVGDYLHEVCYIDIPSDYSA